MKNNGTNVHTMPAQFEYGSVFVYMQNIKKRTIRRLGLEIFRRKKSRSRTRFRSRRESKFPYQVHQ
jgi:hypothetical protein